MEVILHLDICLLFSLAFFIIPVMYLDNLRNIFSNWFPTHCPSQLQNRRTLWQHYHSMVMCWQDLVPGSDPSQTLSFNANTDVSTGKIVSALLTWRIGFQIQILWKTCKNPSPNWNNWDLNYNWLPPDCKVTMERVFFFCYKAVKNHPVREESSRQTRHRILVCVTLLFV